MDFYVNVGAVAYGALLVAAAFVRTPLTEALRIDALFIPQAGERSRPLNLLIGLLVAAYATWSLLRAA